MAQLAFRYAEPVGSVRPKFPSMDNINGLSVCLGENIPLLCPAQGFPVPSHRYDRNAEEIYLCACVYDRNYDINIY